MAMQNRVKESREAEGISRAELARNSDLAERTVKRVEDGDESCTTVTKNKIIKGFNSLVKKQHIYTVEYLFPNSN